MPMMRQRNTGRARGEVKCGKIKKWLATNISYAHADQSVALACVNHFAVLKGGDPFHSAATNRKVWLARLNEGTWFKTLWTVTAMLHAQLSKPKRPFLVLVTQTTSNISITSLVPRLLPCRKGGVFCRGGARVRDYQWP